MTQTTFLGDFAVRNRLFAILPARELEPQDASDALGIGHRTLGYLRRQDLDPGLELAHRISEYLSLPADHVFWRCPPLIFPCATNPLASVPAESAALGELQLAVWGRAGRLGAANQHEAAERLRGHLSRSVRAARHHQPLEPASFGVRNLVDSRLALQSAVAREIEALTGDPSPRDLLRGLSRSVGIARMAGMPNDRCAERLLSDLAEGAA